MGDSQPGVLINRVLTKKNNVYFIWDESLFVSYLLKGYLILISYIFFVDTENVFLFFVSSEKKNHTVVHCAYLRQCLGIDSLFSRYDVSDMTIAI